MQFTLTYRGPLKSNARPDAKHELRRHFHSQLKLLWATYPLRDYGDWVQPMTEKNQFSVLQFKHGFTFAPLVCQTLHAVAELNIKLLWSYAPGSIITSGGDIDNRFKTLFDALKLPSEPTALPKGVVPEQDENPFYCLLEDDSLIARVTVDADRLLEKTNGSSEVALFIRVTTRNLGDEWKVLP
ncbi:MAG: hypothetical protein ACRESZ_04750 [Methylococcales bacterium]